MEKVHLFSVHGETYGTYSTGKEQLQWTLISRFLISAYGIHVPDKRFHDANKSYEKHTG